MDKVTYRITLDTHRSGVQKTLYGFFAGDVLARKIAISLVGGSMPCKYDEVTAAVMYVTKPNGTTSYNACTVSDNTIFYDVLQTDTDTAGIVTMQFKVMSGETVLYAPEFALEVQASKNSDTPAESTPTYTALEEALLKTETVAANEQGRVDAEKKRAEEYGTMRQEMQEIIAEADAILTAGGISEEKAQRLIDEATKDKVDKEEGKGLSTNDYSDAEKQQVADNKDAITNITNGTTAVGNALKANGVTLYKEFTEIDSTFTQDTAITDVVAKMVPDSKLCVTIYGSLSGIYPHVNGVLEIDKHSVNGNFTAVKFTNRDNGKLYSAVVQNNIFIGWAYSADGGNALQLGDKSASEYALAEELDTFIPTHSQGNTEAEIDSIYASFHANVENGTHYVRSISHGYSHSILGGGRFLVEGFRASDEYGWQRTTAYTALGYTATFEREISAATWKPWRKDATTADVENAIAEINLGWVNILESELDTFTTTYNIPDSLTYTATISPKTSSDGNYLMGGTAFSIIGVDYNNHLYGHQFIIGIYGVKRRSLYGGVWSPWQNLVTTADLANYLKNTGGTIENGAMVSLEIKNTNENNVAVLYSGADGQLGFIGFHGADNPAFIPADGSKWYEFLHTGNKPSGSYTGNGSATERIIATGGSGQAVMVWGNSYIGIGCNYIGGFSVRVSIGTGNVVPHGTNFWFDGSSIHIETDSEAVNASGGTYYYQVL